MVCCSCVLYGIAAVALLVAVLRIYLKLSAGWCRSKKCLVGKTVIVTGANSGIGLEAAKDFAMRGARVILACRNEERAENARRKIVEETGNKNVVVKLVDLASLESVRRFAKDINATEDRLDILVNNAGFAFRNEEFTKDGHVFVYQVNYFSHFLLTILLIDLLKKSGPSRIVNVSSGAAKSGVVEMDKLHESPAEWKDYKNSKLYQILFTKELAKRVAKNQISVYSLHPGVVHTEIFQGITGKMRILMQLLVPLGLFKTPLEGAQTTLHTALEKDLDKYSGDHFADCKVDNYPNANVEPEVLRKFWEKTAQVLKLTTEEQKIVSSL